MTPGKDAFGDPGLISSDIAPTYEKQRTLNAAREWFLWMALALGAISASTGRYLGEAVWGVAARSAAVVGVTLSAALLLHQHGVALRRRLGSTIRVRRSAPARRFPCTCCATPWVSAGLPRTCNHSPSGWPLLVQATGTWAAPQAGLEWTATAELTHWGTLAVLALLLGWVARGRISTLAADGALAAVLRQRCVRHGVRRGAVVSQLDHGGESTPSRPISSSTR